MSSKEAVDAVWSDYEKGIRSTYLIKGVTGSGKTEVYMELIAKMQKAGRQAIVPDSGDCADVSDGAAVL